MDWGAIIVAGLGGGFLVAVVNAFANREKNKAESKKIQADVVATLAEYYSEELETMRAEIKSLQGGRKSDEVTIDDLKKAVKQRDKRIAELETQVAEMRKQIDDLLNEKCPQ